MARTLEIIKCQVESRNNEFPADQIEQNAKKCVVSTQDQSHTIFQSSNNNHASVVIGKNRGEYNIFALFFLARESYATVANILKDGEFRKTLNLF